MITMGLTIYFLRHGEATHNVAAREHGDKAYNDPIHTDASLTDIGFEQSRNVKLDSKQISAIYCSSLRRCRQTLLSAIQDSQYRHVFVDDRLMEPQGHICNRRLEKSDLLREIGDMLWSLQRVASSNPYSGSEGYEDFCRRIIAFTDSIVASSKELNHTEILIVSHHEWIRTWFALYKQKQVSPANAQVMVATI